MLAGSAPAILTPKSWQAGHTGLSLHPFNETKPPAGGLIVKAGAG